jgi:hypothetical protein
MGSGRGRQVVPPAIQIIEMRRSFPTMDLVDRAHLVWRGPVQPTESGVVYDLELYSRYRKAGGVPRVWVTNPPLTNTPGRTIPPHCYPDRSLCLYHPRENPWGRDQVIAETVMPWACGWLVFYETWLDTGRWLGPEYDHSGDKAA